MKKRLNKSLALSVLRGVACILSIFAITLTFVLTGLGRTQNSVREAGQRAASEAVHRAALCCYALEGSYPESYDYLKEHYDPEINEALYTVHYIAVASNIMPEITVTKR